MGQVGRYIDSRSDEAKDRIIQAPNWAATTWVLSPECKCLVGYAEDMTYNEDYVSSDGFFAGIRVVSMFTRFGVPRMSRLFKLRAAKNNLIEISAEIAART